MICPYPCQNKTEYGHCKTTGCINPEFDRTRTFTWYDPIEIARQYAPKFDKPVVDMVEVVWCKDCKYKVGENTEYDDAHCEIHERGNNRELTVGDYDYCSWGRVKESEE